MNGDVSDDDAPRRRKKKKRKGDISSDDEEEETGGKGYERVDPPLPVRSLSLLSFVLIATHSPHVTLMNRTKCFSASILKDSTSAGGPR